MSTLNIEMIHEYLVSMGCKIEYPILVNAFKKHLYNPDPDLQGKIRTQFKDYVNRLATVSLENNMKFINLRPEYIPSRSKEHSSSNKPQQQPPSNPQQPSFNIPKNPHSNGPQQSFNMTLQRSPSITTQQSFIIQQQSSSSIPKQPTVQPHSIITHETLPIVPKRSNPGGQSLPPSQIVPPHKSSIESAPQQPAERYTPSRQPSLNIKQPPLRQSILQQSTTNRQIAMQENLRTLFNNQQYHSSLSLAAPTSSEHNTNIHPHQQMSAPRRNESLREVGNRHLRDYSNSTNTAGGGLSTINLQRNGSYLTTRSRSSHRGEDESDSSSLQPTMDPWKRKWAIEACSCNYNGLVSLLREEPKLASYRDIVNGYTALHWAAKFGNLDIIKLIAGTHGVSSDIKSSSGQTPLHVAYMFNRPDAARLLLEIYKASPDIRDHSGKRPLQYLRKDSRQTINKVNLHSTTNYNNNSGSV